MIVGKFAFADGVYTGSVPTLSNLSVRIVQAKKKGVDYDVLLGDTDVELGVAWKKTSGKGNAYLSVKLDAPHLPGPTNCALLGQDDGTYVLVWKRNASDAKGDAVPEAEAA